MIAETSSGRDFSALFDYLLRGRDGQHPERVAWSAVRNLSVDDPETAAAIMQATADENVRVEDAVYQLTLNFHPTDRVTPDQIRDIADRMLRDLGLDDHQAVMVAHNDRAHAHVHLAINRVHPGTHHAWARWQDWMRIERSRRAIEKAYGLVETDGPLDKPRAKEMHVPTVEQAVHGDRVTEAATAVRAAERQQKLELDLDTAVSALKAAEARAALVERAIARVADARREFEAAFGRIYVAPDAAHVAFRASADQHGPDAALRMLAQHPEKFGALAVEIRHRGFGLLEVHDTSRARQQATFTAGVGHEAVTAERAVRAAADSQARPQPAPSRDASSAQPSIAEITRAARQAAAAEVSAARHTVDALLAERRQLRDGPSIRRVLGQLSPAEFGRLRALLTAPQLAIVRSVSRAVRRVALGHELE